MNVLLVGMPMSQERIAAQIPLPEGAVPLGVGYVAAYARQDPFINGRATIEILRYPVGLPGVDDQDDEHLLQLITLREPDVVGFSCEPWNMEKVRHVSHILKLAAPTTRVVWGGPEAGFWPDVQLTRNPAVDVVVCGEGEVTFVELLKAWLTDRSMADVLGIAHRENGRVVVAPARPPIARLDDLPSPYLSGTLDPKQEPESNHIMLEGFRECPYRCGYCTSPGHPRFFSMDRLREEIEYCFEHDIESFAMVDPFVNLGRKRLIELSNILYDIDPKQKKWGAAFVMAELIDEQDAVALARMNTPLVKTGIQSTNPVVLDNIRRHVDHERFARGIRLMQDAGLPVSLHVLAGLPGDTFDGLRRTMDFALSLKPDSILCFSALLLPGSYLFEMRDKFEIVFDERSPHRIFSHYSLTFDQLTECLEFGFETSYEYTGLDRQQRESVTSVDMDRWRTLARRKHVRRFNTGR